jgi:hypothetical protein
LRRKELPELIDADIEWLCGLTEAAEAWEPVSSVGPGKFITPAPRARPSKRRGGGNGTAVASTPARASPGASGASASPQSTPADATISGRKRKAITSSLPSRRSPRLHSEQSALRSTGDAAAQPESNLHSQIRTLDSHRRPRNWLCPNDPIAFSFREPRGGFMALAPGRGDRCTFYRCLLLYCRFLPVANNIRPQGRTRSSFLRLRA